MDDRYRRDSKDCSNVGWNSLEIPRRSSTRRRGKSSRFSIGMTLLVVGALGAHGALAFFGYRWISSQSAPAVPAIAVNAAIHATPSQVLAPVAPKPLAPKDQIAGKLHWSRHEGMSIRSDPAKNWKCAGGYTYSTTIGTNGSTAIELVQENNRPLRCKG